MREYCQWERFQPRCGPGKVIMMNRARYGRMSYGKCIERDYGYVGCSNDVLLLLDARCSGRRNCDVRIPDEFLDATKPCPKDLIRYLAADWECIPGKRTIYIKSIIDVSAACVSTLRVSAMCQHYVSSQRVDVPCRCICLQRCLGVPWRCCVKSFTT